MESNDVVEALALVLALALTRWFVDKCDNNRVGEELFDATADKAEVVREGVVVVIAGGGDPIGAFSGHSRPFNSLILRVNDFDFLISGVDRTSTGCSRATLNSSAIVLLLVLVPVFRLLLPLMVVVVVVVMEVVEVVVVCTVSMSFLLLLSSSMLSARGLSNCGAIPTGTPNGLAGSLLIGSINFSEREKGSPNKGVKRLGSRAGSGVFNGAKACDELVEMLL
jgi:hypothetical protein